MKNEWQGLTLENCADGALAEEFERGIALCLEDLLEDGKLSSDKRVITLTVELTGHKSDADFLNIKVGSDVKLAKRQPHPSVFAMKDGSSPTGIVQKVNVQEKLPLVDGGKVTPFDSAKGAGGEG